MQVCGCRRRPQAGERGEGMAARLAVGSRAAAVAPGRERGGAWAWAGAVWGVRWSGGCRTGRWGRLVGRYGIGRGLFTGRSRGPCERGWRSGAGQARTIRSTSAAVTAWRPVVAASRNAYTLASTSAMTAGTWSAGITRPSRLDGGGGVGQADQGQRPPTCTAWLAASAVGLVSAGRLEHCAYQSSPQDCKAIPHQPGRLFDPGLLDITLKLPCRTTVRPTAVLRRDLPIVVCPGTTMGKCR
jgi:hypothetical protein